MLPFLSVGVISSPVTEGRTLSPSLFLPCPGPAVLVRDMAVIRQAVRQKSTDLEHVCSGSGDLSDVH